MQRRVDNAQGILNLWLTWMWGSGMMVALILFSLWVRPVYMPFIAFGLQLVAFILIRHNRSRRLPLCYVYPFIISHTMFWSGTVMLVINLIYSRWILPYVFDPATVNSEIPFIVTLLVSPINAIICLWAYSKHSSLSFCRDCQLRNGSPAERGFLGMLYNRESRYQMWVSLLLSSATALTGWIYYAISYVNSSISSPDRLVFFWLETGIWIAGAIYFGMRYLGIWGYYTQDVEGSFERLGRSALVRFYIIEDDRIAVRPPQLESDKLLVGSRHFDTPVTIFEPFAQDYSVDKATRLFRNMTQIERADIRPFFKNTNGNADCNIFHFFAFLTPEQRTQLDTAVPTCQWITFRELATLINDGLTNPLFSAATLRLYDITMAWKTYHIDGRRRYKIKHYRPTFKIEDAKKWDVDYNDPTWLFVSKNNQDTPFYNMRRFWRKYVSGVGDYMEELK